MPIDDADSKLARSLPRINVKSLPKLVDALTWVTQVYPHTDRHRAAVIHMTWAEWNVLRAALGLPLQPEK